MKSLEEQVHELQGTVESMQAQLDALMLEFCPDRMTEAQKENWAKHQVPADPQPSVKDLSGYERITSNEQLIADHYYWVRSKRDKGAFFVAPVKNKRYIEEVLNAHAVTEEPGLALVINNMSFWCYEGNSQALENFEIYGPINEPYHIEVVG